MRLSRAFRIALMFCVSLGAVIPSVSPAAEPRPARQQEETSAYTDVALDANGILRGQVTTTSGTPAAGVQMAIHQETRQVAQVTTGDDGSFEVSGLKSGVYTVSTSEGTRAFRVWTHRAAPPHANQGILFVNDAETIRGQLVSRFGLGILALGAVTATVIAVSISHNSGS